MEAREKSRSLRQRIQILLALLVAVPMLLLLYESFQTSRSTLIAQMKSEALRVAQLESAEVDDIFEPPYLIASALVRSIETMPTLEPERIRQLIGRTLTESPFLYGVAVALDPEATPLKRFAPYAFRPQSVETEITLPYDYTQRDWFVRPMASGRGEWFRPYYGEGGKALMVSYIAPIRKQGQVIGVVAIDLDLDSLIQRLSALNPGGSGSVYLVSGPPGTILAHPALLALDDVPPNKEMSEMAVLIQQRGIDTVEMIDPISRRNSWVVEAPIRSLSKERGGGGWSVIVSWPLDERLAPLGNVAIRMLVVYVFLGGAALWFLNRTIDDTITRPLRRLTEQAKQFAAGNFGSSAMIRHEASELRDLGNALDALGATLQEKQAAQSTDATKAP